MTQMKMSDNHQIITYRGNISILKEPKIAFFCSNKCSADLIIKSYDWAMEMRDKGKCVISGFHTKIEQDVFNFLTKGKQPIIKVPARGKYKNISKEEQRLIDDGRLLYLFFFDDNVTYQSKETCIERNKRIAEIADEIFIAYAHPGGKLEQLLQYAKSINKTVKKI